MFLLIIAFVTGHMLTFLIEINKGNYLGLNSEHKQISHVEFTLHHFF